ncbi:hypothetical protein PsYK624_154720 [Phanerochaete sordida]|uniref:Uncharacterized protein n=1 Tax=Phanerochaete sordida TaxID=48140 RepID=A0A9P3LMC8_9APHY|nr:hypothetical protein PsYK624_154720 [Phanerochaete sordida]
MMSGLLSLLGFLVSIEMGDVMHSLGLGVVVEAARVAASKKEILSRGGQNEACTTRRRCRESGLQLHSSARTSWNNRPYRILHHTKGLFDAAHLEAGEIVVVLGAAGARVVAIPGGNLLQESASFRADWGTVASRPHVYFDSFGGDILDLTLTQLKRDASIMLCGATSEYNSDLGYYRLFSALRGTRADEELPHR